MFAQDPGAHVDHFAQSFALQYIALILFILIFTIGAFTPKNNAKVPPKTVQAPIAMELPTTPDAPLPEIPLTDLGYSDFFDERGAKLQNDKIDGLTFFLRNHDVRIDIEIPFGVKVNTHTALERSRNLFEHFIQNNVPPKSISIIAAPTHGAEQIKVKVFHEKP